jgi:hypothetical protein
MFLIRAYHHVPLTLLGLFWAHAALASGNIAGHCVLEKIKGQPQAGFKELYEWNLFISPPTEQPVGITRRLGTSCEVTGPGGRECSTNIITHDGCYCADNLPSGNYSLLLSQPIFFAVPRVVPDVGIVNGQTINIDVESPIDFSTYFLDSWTSPDTAWYQTFTATGTSITGVSWVLAGTQATDVEVAILEDNSDPDVRNWRVLGTADRGSLGTLGDTWVRWRSGENPTIPGHLYAVRIQGTHGPALTFQPFKRDKDSNSYANGRAYNAAGQPQNFDLNVTVFSDNSGTRLTVAKRRCCLGTLENLRMRWAQSFRAKGGALAAADLWFAGAHGNWDITFQWRIHQGQGLSNVLMGPVKTTRPAWQGPGVGLQGVSYSPHEAVLTPNQMYTIEMIAIDPPPESPGFNPHGMHPDDSYDEGMAFRYDEPIWTPISNHDLAMTIMEYSILIELSQSAIHRTVYVGNDLSPDELTIRNAGAGTLTWSLQSNASYVRVSPRNGTSNGEPTPVTVSYLTSALPIGEYNVKLYLTSNSETGLQTIPVHLTVRTIPPDFDGDADVDQEDFGHFQHCLTGPGHPQTEPACLDARLDDDEDVDQDDFGIFQSCMSGAGIMADSHCMDP